MFPGFPARISDMRNRFFSSVARAHVRADDAEIVRSRDAQCNTKDGPLLQLRCLKKS